MTNTTLTPKSAKAIGKYGLKACLEMLKQNSQGDGAKTIAFERKLTTRQADAAINAAQEYVSFKYGAFTHTTNVDACNLALSKIAMEATADSAITANTTPLALSNDEIRVLSYALADYVADGQQHPGTANASRELLIKVQEYRMTNRI